MSKREDAKQERAQDAERRERDEARTREAYREVFNTTAGRLVLLDLLERCHVFTSIFRRNSEFALLEGERNIGLYLAATAGGADDKIARLVWEETFRRAQPLEHKDV